MFLLQASRDPSGGDPPDGANAKHAAHRSKRWKSASAKVPPARTGATLPEPIEKQTVGHPGETVTVFRETAKEFGTFAAGNHDRDGQPRSLNQKEGARQEGVRESHKPDREHQCRDEEPMGTRLGPKTQLH
jgi:hypothetical protein